MSLAFFLKRRNSSSLSLRLNGLMLLSSCENIYIEASDVLLAGYYEKLLANMLRVCLLFSSLEDNIKTYRKEMTALQTGKSRVRFPMVSLEFFIDIILPAAL